MVIDYSRSPAVARLFRVVDAATGRPIDGDLFWADDDRAIYRAYDRDERGAYFTRSVATRSRLDHVEGLRTNRAVAVFADGTRGGAEEVAWTEYYLPIRIEPRPGLSEADREYAGQLLSRAGAV